MPLYTHDANGDINKIINAYLRHEGMNQRDAAHVTGNVEHLMGSGFIDWVKKHKKKLLAALGLVATVGSAAYNIHRQNQRDFEIFGNAKPFKSRGYDDDKIFGDIHGDGKVKRKRKGGKANSLRSEVMKYKHDHNVSLAEAWSHFR